MLELSKPKNNKAIERAAHSIRVCINGLKLLWFGNMKVSTSDLSDVLYDSYVQGFLYTITETNIKLFIHGSLSKNEKKKALSIAFSQGFDVEEYDVSEWMQDLDDKLVASDDVEFRRGAVNGIIMTKFVQDPNENHQDSQVQRLLERARTMPDPRGWLVAHLWFEELERLKPEFFRRQNTRQSRNGSLSAFPETSVEELSATA